MTFKIGDLVRTPNHNVDEYALLLVVREANNYGDILCMVLSDKDTMDRPYQSGLLISCDHKIDKMEKVMS